MTKRKPLPEIEMMPGMGTAEITRTFGGIAVRYYEKISPRHAMMLGPTRATERGAIEAGNRMVRRIRNDAQRGY